MVNRFYPKTNNLNKLLMFLNKNNLSKGEQNLIYWLMESGMYEDISRETNQIMLWNVFVNRKNYKQ